MQRLRVKPLPRQIYWAVGCPGGFGLSISEKKPNHQPDDTCGWCERAFHEHMIGRLVNQATADMKKFYGRKKGD